MLRSSAQGVDPPVCRVLDVAGKMLRSSAQGVDPPVCRTPGCYCYICKRQLCGFPQCAASWMTYARDSFVDSPSGAFCPLEGGGEDRLASGLQFPPSGTVWATHGVSCSVTFVVVRWAALRGKGVVPPWGDLCVLWHPSEDVDLAHRKVLCHFQAK